MMRLTPDRREEISELILDLIIEEGNITEDQKRAALLGIAKRQQEVAEKIGIPVEEVESYCWEMVKLMIFI